MNEKFAYLITKACDKIYLESGFAVLLLVGLSGFFLYWGIKVPFIPLLLLGLGIAIMTIYVINKSMGDFKGSSYWIDMINNNPENIVWIKPIVTRHTVGFVLTLYKERKFQLLTKDKLKLIINCDTEKDQKVFFEGVKTHLSHTHIGYNEEINELYKENPNDFIASLNAKRLYMPIAAFH